MQTITVLKSRQTKESWESGFRAEMGKLTASKKTLNTSIVPKKKINDFSNESARIFQLNTNMNTAI